MSNLENYMKQQAIFCEQNDSISKNLYSEYGVKRGLRDEKGQGVLTGLTNISDIKAFEYRDGVKSPCDGELSYRGYNIKDLVTGSKGKRFVFEEGAYLLLFGELPTDTQLMEFQGRLSDCMELPTNFTRDVIMKAPTSDIMGSMTRSILTLGSYDKEKESLEIPNVLRQSMQLIAVFPMLAVYAYHAYCHYEKNESMYIHRPEKDLSIAENFLRLLRPDTKFTELEARVLDIALLLHMEHGGGNNSTFTTRVVTSSGSDTYSVISAAMSSLKGKKHGGANLMVMNMMDDIKSHVKDYEDEEEIASYLSKILKKEAFDQKGLIYGMGHAVYSISDPRERVFKGFVEQLARDKGREKDMTLYNNIEKIAPKLIAKQRQIFKGVSPNIDFYSGFVYDMLNIPRELYTPLFAIARIAGWSAHRLEELITTDKIIRPAYKSLVSKKEYIERVSRKLPWGISESAYSELDNSLKYKYKAFSTPYLKAKEDKENRVVLSPYASIMAMELFPDSVISNIEAFMKLGMYGKYGLYESYDYDNKNVVEAYFAHHQGMILVGLVNYLKKNVIKNYFHSNLSIRTFEILLKEKVQLRSDIDMKMDSYKKYNYKNINI